MANAYAVIRTGGKQYRVVSGAKIKVESLPVEVGQKFSLNHVLAIARSDENASSQDGGAVIELGTPMISGASVTAKVLSHGKGDKVRIFKMNRRKHYQKRQGHRQSFTELEICEILSGTLNSTSV